MMQYSGQKKIMVHFIHYYIANMVYSLYAKYAYNQSINRTYLLIHLSSYLSNCQSIYLYVY